MRYGRKQNFCPHQMYRGSFTKANLYHWDQVLLAFLKNNYKHFVKILKPTKTDPAMIARVKVSSSVVVGPCRALSSMEKLPSFTATTQPADPKPTEASPVARARIEALSQQLVASSSEHADHESMVRWSRRHWRVVCGAWRGRARLDQMSCGRSAAVSRSQGIATTVIPLFYYEEFLLERGEALIPFFL